MIKRLAWQLLANDTEMDEYLREPRKAPDRRRQSTSIPVCRFATPRRRRSFRRSGEGLDCYADAISPRMTLWLVALLVLSAVDAALTLIHIRSGGDELVPTMRLALGQGEGFFITVKLLMTALGGLFLAVHERFRLAKVFIPITLIAYVTLMAYHVVVALARQ